nr:MAG TPA: hypothetical protein [Caudoviricetes sp.]
MVILLIKILLECSNNFLSTLLVILSSFIAATSPMCVKI